MINSSMEVVVSTDTDDVDLSEDAMGEVNPIPIDIEDEERLRVSPSRKSRLSASDLISVSSLPDSVLPQDPDVSIAPSITSSMKPHISKSVEDLLISADLENCRNRLSRHGYDSMRSLRLASKEDLVEIGLPRGHAGLLVYAIAQEDKGHGPGKGLTQIETRKLEDQVLTPKVLTSSEAISAMSEKGDYKVVPGGGANDVGKDLGVKDPKAAAPDREGWGKKLDFLLVCIGYAVGLGNIWRFPYLCYTHGGGVFLIPYFLMLFLAGMPLMFLELAFGQYGGEGPITIWKACPLFAGIGWAMVMISGMVAIYYNIIMAWTALFFVRSFTSEVPWKSCNNTWNTDACQENSSVAMDMGLNDTKRPSQEFYYNYVLGVDGHNLDDMGAMKWELVVCLLFSWIVIFCCICKSVKSSGKVVYFTATFPYVILTILLIRGVTLPGAEIGINYYLSPRWEKLKETQVWGAAATQIFYSLGPAWGGVLTFSSYNKFNNNCLVDAICIPLINCLSSFYAGFVVFSTLGFMSYKTGISIDNVAVRGPGLVFETYPEAISQMPVAPLWAILFFFMFFLVGLDTQFGMVETVVSGLVDYFPNHLRKHGTLVALAVCVFFFLLGLPMASQGGIYMFELINWYSCWISLMLVGCFECLAVVYFYGVRRFMGDIRRMVAEYTWMQPVLTPLLYWYSSCWLVITPAIILFITVFGMINYVPVYFGDYVYPKWSEVLGWLMAVVPLLTIPLVMVIKLCFASEGDNYAQRFLFLLKPTRDWENKEKRFQAKTHLPLAYEKDVELDSLKTNGMYA
ncbi:sodium- and chloride-dependent glycine transporter 1-like isoform X1 [Lytechinus pictus]|uniref:sodium- and chloride-dependent glycine transporter 1-like isoform X1 n=1 Tax=Lytechinus pictus TaxID=7653 RepID=UPI0030BA2A29